MTPTSLPAPEAGVSEAMVESAMAAWSEQPDREDDMSLERSLRAALEAALSTAPAGDGVTESCGCVFRDLNVPCRNPECEVCHDTRLHWYLTILAGMGGSSDASDNPHCWLNTFCDDRADGDDTYNMAEEAGLTQTSHQSDFDISTVYLTDAGKQWLSTASNREAGK